MKKIQIVSSRSTSNLCSKSSDYYVENVTDLKNIKNADLIIMPYYENIYHNGEICGVWEMLIWLRIKNMMCHVCIVGNMTIESIMRLEKRAFMIGTRGVSYIQLPEILDNEKIFEKIEDKADPDNVKSVMSMLIDIHHMRHVYANIWGLDRIVTEHQMYYKDINIGDIKKNIKVDSDFNYQMAKYVFDEPLGFYKEYRDASTLKAIQNLNNALSRADRLVVLVIDDKSEMGWLKIYESILNYKDEPASDFARQLAEIFDNGEQDKKCKIINMRLGNIDESLEKKYDEILRENKQIDIVVLDMKLYPQEASIKDYNELKSIKLMKYVYNKAEKNKRDYWRTKFMISTASNQLMNYKNVLTPKYMPASIFIKEGFDFLINNEKSKDNYRNLIDSFQRAISQSVIMNKRSAARADDGYAEDELKLIRMYEEFLCSKNWYDDGQKIKKIINGCDNVLIDTCIYYYQKRPYIMSYYYGDKVKCFYPVYFEMLRLSKTKEPSFRSYMAEKQVARYRNDIYDLGLSEQDKSDIHEKLKRERDVADKYFLPVIQYLKDENDNSKILLLTNDKQVKDEVEEWVDNNHIKDVSVLGSKNLIS